LACFGSDPRNLEFNFDRQAHTGWNAYIVAQTPNADRMPNVHSDSFESIEHLGTISIERNGVIELGNIQLYYAQGYRPR
jgi:hypothetical protein